MGRRIDDETIIRINEVYLECGVKSRTAQIVGVSPSTVTKYLIPDYKSRKEANEVPVVFEGTCAGVDNFIERIDAAMDSGWTPMEAFCEFCKLIQDEWDEMEEIQKGIIL